MRFGVKRIHIKKVKVEKRGCTKTDFWGMPTFMHWGEEKDLAKEIVREQPVAGRQPRESGGLGMDVVNHAPNAAFGTSEMRH